VRIIRVLGFISLYFVLLANIPAAENKSITEISIAAVRTELEKEAVAYVIKHMPKNDIYRSDSLGFTDLSPNIELQTGGDDSFNGLIAKLQGHKTIMKEVDDPNTGKRTCSECMFSVIPFAVGVETDRNIEDVNLLGEVGYFPVGKSRNGKPRYGLNGPRIGIFLQAGYKFKTDERTVEAGGATDESEEEPDSELIRTKIDIRGKFGNDSNLFNFIPGIRGWYDFVNSEIYYKLEAAFRLNIVENIPFEFKYENGSGAPNFNEGEQFSAGIAMTF